MELSEIVSTVILLGGTTIITAGVVVYLIGYTHDIIKIDNAVERAGVSTDLLHSEKTLDATREQIINAIDNVDHTYLIMTGYGKKYASKVLSELEHQINNYETSMDETIRTKENI